MLFHPARKSKFKVQQEGLEPKLIEL